MAIPWNMDVLRPAETPKFKRAKGRLKLSLLDFAEAAELAVFVDMVGVDHARWIFNWYPPDMAEAMRLVEHFRALGPDHDARLSENNDAIERADGLAVLGAMMRGGWHWGSVPPIVRLALLDMRDCGMTWPQIAGVTGLTVDQLRRMAGLRRRHGAGPVVSGRIGAITA